MTHKQKVTLVRILAASVMLTALFFLPDMPKPQRAALYLVPYLVIGYDILRKAFHGLWQRRPLDENFLMAISTLGAMALGEYPEGVAVMLFYQVGELFQSYAVGKSRRAIGALMDVRPDTATLVDADGKPQSVHPSSVPVGALLLVAPGEKIPIDGVIEEGDTMLDTSQITGESVMRRAKTGDAVPAGTVNLSGLIRLRTTCAFGEDTASKMLELLENAASKKSTSEAFITRFARMYTPAVCAAALSLAVLGPLVSRVFSKGDAALSVWLYRALTFLVISCPCALVISIPLSFFAALGGASKRGILIKGSNHLETLSSVRCFAFDKTGTITRGVFEVVGVYPSHMADTSLLSIAALAEAASPHPIAAALRVSCPEALDPGRVSDVRELPGRGVSANVDGKRTLVGSDRLMDEEHIAYLRCEAEGTTVHVARGGVYLGRIVIADIIKSEAKAAVSDLRASGIRKTVMLSGDVPRTAEAVAKAVGIDEAHASLLPSDKTAHLEALIAREGPVAFCGDGINDAPVLMRADVGISMGALGSDAAIEASDVVIGDDDLSKLPLAVRHAKKCMRIVHENIVFALGVKALCLLLTALGLSSMWAAIFADVGVMVLAVLNALRALHAPSVRRL